jgi:fumarate hydratase subunit alpha
MAVVFLEIGQEIQFTGGYIIDAVNSGVKKAYQNGYLRKSIVSDPIARKNTNDNLPAVIHTEITKGDKLKISVSPKGFGSENQSGIKMLSPSAGREGIVDFIVSGVIKSGSKGCPPCIIGVGIGGNFEYSALLAKKALMIPLDEKNPDDFYRNLEDEIMDKINSSRIGVMGLGGDITCLGVKILTHPTHIAGLPVAYNYCCHSCRHKSVVI